MSEAPLPTEDEAIKNVFSEEFSTLLSKETRELAPDVPTGGREGKDMIISFRASFSGFVVSLVDACPSEIAVLALRNVNVLATWNTKRTTDATVYITVTDFQVDNMVPNAPFGVAVTRDEAFKESSADNSSSDETQSPMEDAAPLLVIGLSFAPKHKSGIVVSSCQRPARLPFIRPYGPVLTLLFSPRITVSEVSDHRPTKSRHSSGLGLSSPPTKVRD